MRAFIFAIVISACVNAPDPCRRQPKYDTACSSAYDYYGAPVAYTCGSDYDDSPPGLDPCFRIGIGSGYNTAWCCNSNPGSDR